jgi:RNA methyltransferase, TrmH family
MITSKTNKSFKLWKSLKLKKYRDMHNFFLVYGKHLVEKAEEKGAIVEILTTDEQQKGTLLSKALMDDLQQAETYFDVIAVCKKTNSKIESTRILMLDDVQDPDNVGALIRSAAAFGFVHIILSLKSADVYNEKVIRASKGALFDVYIERRPLEDAILELKQQNYQILYADAHGSGSPKLENNLVLILGNEGHGVSEHIKALSDFCVNIDTKRVESLNVSVAGGILMHQWREL